MYFLSLGLKGLKGNLLGQRRADLPESFFFFFFFVSTQNSPSGPFKYRHSFHCAYDELALIVLGI